MKKDLTRRKRFACLQSEDAVSEVVQKDGEPCALYRSYQNARSDCLRKSGFVASGK